MLILAIDTALGAATAVAADGERLLAVRCRPMARGHQEAIATLTRDAMAEAGIAFSDLGRIGVTVGPGSFTGLRVGLAFAKGLALAWETPLVGIGTLEALAASAPAGRTIAAIDAGRGQVYVQSFGDGVEGPPRQLALTDAERLVQDHHPEIMVGSAVDLLAAAPAARRIALAYASPEALVGRTLAAAPPAGPPRPLYLRAPDARTLAERGVVK
jgi:tRNA threonylcarbamoyladenosine biosynthesis protein TsaB